VVCDVEIASPSGSSLDVKKSSYKKLSKLLAAMQQRGFVQVKELSKGVESIVSIDRDHLESVQRLNLFAFHVHEKFSLLPPHAVSSVKGRASDYR